MPEIRLILLIIGALVVLGVYLWGRRRTPDQVAMEEDWLEELARRKREGISPTRKAPPQQKRVAPGLGEPRPSPTTVEADDLPPMPAPVKAEPAPAPKPAVPRNEVPPQHPAEPRPAVKKTATPATKTPGPGADERMLLVLFIVAGRGRKLAGMDILAAAKQVNLQHGDKDVFYLYEDPDTRQQALFTMASMMEPGSFDLANLDHYETPGLALFSQLPTAISASATFEKMLAVGRHMAQALNAELKDESRSTLTLQTIGHIREKVKDYDFRQQKHHPQ